MNTDKGEGETMMKRHDFLAVICLTPLSLTAATGRANADSIGCATEVKNANLLSVDLITATATVIGGTGLGLALSPNGTLFATDSNGSLYTLNKTTGAATLIGDTGLGDVEGLAFNGNSLVAANLNATSLYTLNTTTGAATLLVNTNPNLNFIRSLTITGNNIGLVETGTQGHQTLSSVSLTNGVTP
jgi:hypothetical protein